MKNKGLIAIVALSSMVMSCDSNLPGKASGPEVSVQVQLLGIAENGEEDRTRSASPREWETVSMPIGDGMLLEMSLEREKSPLRAKVITPLSNGAYFRVIAVKTGTSEYVAHGDFTVNGATSLSSFHVPANETFDFICYSYNSTNFYSIQSFSAERGEDLVDRKLSTGHLVDLLWQKQTVSVGESNPLLTILLEPVMARVKVVLDCSYNGWTVTDVSSVQLSPVATSGQIGLVSGTPSGNAVTGDILWTGMSQGTVIESDPLLVMPKTGELTIKIPKHAITRQNFTENIPTDDATMNASGTFSTTLAAGSSYKLYVKLRVPKWAGSNIYWVKTGEYDNGSGDVGDVGYLTFDPYYVDGNDAPHKGYQGVFFKFGSLVGISPARASFSTSVAVYIPTYVAGPPDAATWKCPAVSPYSSWPPTSAGDSDSDANAAIIPYLDGRAAFNASNNTRSSTFVIDEARNDATMWANKRGDICQFLSKTGAVSGDYRLPTSSELGTVNIGWSGSTPVGGGWVKGGAPGSATGLASGEFDLIGSYLYVENLTMGNVILPASGNRYGNGGGLDFVTTQGLYWSGSANGNLEGRLLYFTEASIGPNGSSERSCAYPVRCVKN
jgi:hypothetical protein